MTQNLRNIASKTIFEPLHAQFVHLTQKGIFLHLQRDSKKETPQAALVQVSAAYPWPGTAENGSWLLNGLFQYPGGIESAIAAFWGPTDAPGRHCFSWLPDLRALGGDQARQTARFLIASWMDTHGAKPQKPVWDIECTAKRLSSLILLYDFHGASAHSVYQALTAEIIGRHATYLVKIVPTLRPSRAALEAAAALILAGLATDTYTPWVEVGEEGLCKNLSAQILADGGHISRSPQELAETLRLCIDLKRMYMESGKPAPEQMIQAIDRMADALQVFRFTDRKLTLFHGSQEQSDAILDLLIFQAGASRNKPLRSLPDSGFERMSLGRTVILFDVGKPPAYPFDKKASCAPLAFEMAFGKERIIVNCGTHPFSKEWMQALRATPAHSSVTLANRNAFEVKKDGFLGRTAKRVTSRREELGQAVLVEGEHDGYVPVNNYKHKRRLYLTDRGQDFRGEDTLYTESEATPETPIPFAVRFHLHPRVKVSLVRDGSEALLRLPSGIGWRFQLSGGRLSLEDSVYMGEGYSPVKTRQIVVSGEIHDTAHQIRWALQREGA
ncbi:MAG: heparinase II/III family protein [Pseudobdellovibrionaceae bacterium]